MFYSESDQKGYPRFFVHLSTQWKKSFLISLSIIILGVIFFLWCITVSPDTGGDSFGGLVLAIAGTTFMMLAALGFTIKRRKGKRVVGQLNGILNWHIWFGVIALILLFLHSYGNFNPRSGTYALYGMVAMVISGFVGRVLDKVLPRKIAEKASRALTMQGEDRVESILRDVQSTGAYATGDLRSAQAMPGNMVNYAPVGSAAGRMDMAGAPAGSPNMWDMGYMTVDEFPQGMDRDSRVYRGAERRRPRTRSGALAGANMRHIDALEEVQEAIDQETFYRYVIRMWRMFHILLALVTVGLTAWHIEYALALVIPAIQKYGFYLPLKP